MNEEKPSIISSYSINLSESFFISYHLVDIPMQFILVFLSYDPHQNELNENW